MTMHYTNPRERNEDEDEDEAIVFNVDDRGYSHGKPFVLPHEPGQTAEGLVPGWYRIIGPFDTEAEAKES